MTEAEWLACEDPKPLLEFLKGRTSDRKLRLFAVACCYRLWHLLSDSRNRTAVEMAEVFADGGMTPEELMAFHDDAYHLYSQYAGDEWHASRAAASSAWYFLDDSLKSGSAYFATNNSLRDVLIAIPDQSALCLTLLRDIFGNPFRPVAADPAWLTSTVTALARQMYASRDFSAMPILADALQDAGCDNEAILNHCRSEGIHVRGCWCVDLVLGKE
jgi:hypothetical protein